MSEAQGSTDGWGQSEPPKKKSRVGLWIFIGVAVLVVGVLGIGCLATLIVPGVIQQLNQAFRDKVEADFDAIVSASQEFHTVNGRWPVSLEELRTPDESGHAFLASDGDPRDPWQNVYVFEPSGGDEPPRIVSYGADGVPGGEGQDADITSR